VDYLSQFGTDEGKVIHFSQYHCTAPGLSQIITTTECTAAAQLVGQRKTDAVGTDPPFCYSTPEGNGVNDGTYFVDDVEKLEELFQDQPMITVLCHCRSCDEPSTSLQSPWWTVLGIALGVCFAGGAIAASRAERRESSA
jgi:hypothetical protein